MFITDEDLESRLQSDSNLAKARRTTTNKTVRVLERAILPEAPEDKTLIAPLHNGGRRPGDKNLTDDQRLSIALDARTTDLTLAEVADINQVSSHHTHELKHGKHSNAQGVDAELADEINAALETPHEIAIRKLTRTLLAIPDNLEQKGISPSKLASMANSLASVTDRMSPIKNDANRGAQDCKLIVYAPTFKQENNYNSVVLPSSTTLPT